MQKSSLPKKPWEGMLEKSIKEFRTGTESKPGLTARNFKDLGIEVKCMEKENWLSVKEKVTQVSSETDFHGALESENGRMAIITKENTAVGTSKAQAYS